jgi:hypothetical protein
MRLGVAVLVFSTLVHTQTPVQSLRIVVIEGKDAVNVVQQKTAVRPLIEVRDRNLTPRVREGTARARTPRTHP